MDQVATYFQQGDFDAAAPILEERLKKSPDHADDLSSYGLCLHKAGKRQKAMQHFERALKDPAKSALTLRNVGIFMLEIGQISEALNYLGLSLKKDKQDAMTHNFMGVAQQKVNQLEPAMTSFRKAMSINADYPAPIFNLINTLNTLNKVKEARTALDKAKAEFPDNNMFTPLEAVILRREKRFDEAIAVLEGGDYPQVPMVLINCNKELGILYDKTDQIDKAFAQFDKFNAVVRDKWNITPERKAIYPQQLETFKAAFTKDWVKSWKPFDAGAPEKVAFLFGFARAGTTLIQHILNAHPALCGTEETPAFEQVIAQMAEEVADYPAGLANLSPETVQEYRQIYLARQQKQNDWNPDKQLLIDKYPFASGYAGLIHRLFPDAKMIFAKRHPLDCILSAYMNLFSPNVISIHTYDLENTVNLYCRVMDMWFQYEDLLPLNVHYMSYEDIVTDLEGEARKALDFLEVPWDKAVLNYDEKVRAQANVRTPSFEQVSQKIYDSAQYRWKRYPAHLEPYFDRLSPYAQRLGYEIE